MTSGSWKTYFVHPESCNERVFDHFDDCGNILAATWVARPSWARVEIMGHRQVVGQIRALPHGKHETRRLGKDGELGPVSVYGPAAIFAIHELTEEEAKALVSEPERRQRSLYDDDPDEYGPDHEEDGMPW